MPRGGPDGGDGGRGGTVYLRVDPGETMLRDYRFKHHFRAESGGRGSGSRRHGKAGKDLDLNVPPGTVVRDLATNDLLADLVSREQRVMVARGGRGGLGNTHFATSTSQAPTHAQKGEPGEERRLKLELRLIADIGLVGLPNAGKSTMLSALTAATPQVAPYPFTTLEPNLGVLELDEQRRVTIADMPGLIEGASAGAGLGHAFLRHVSRNRVLAHVVDLSTADPERDYQVIREELEAHDAALLSKVSLVIGNKIDLPEATAAAKAFAARRRKEGAEFVAVSAALGEGIEGLLEALRRLLPDAATLAEPGEPAGVVIHRFENAPDMFSVTRESGAFRVSGRRIERLAAQTDFENEESAERFQRDLARLGIERELVRAGVGQGDTVRIGRVELEWDPD